MKDEQLLAYLKANCAGRKNIRTRAQLQLLPDVGEGLLCAADYDHDITDIPAQVLAALDMAGVCRGRLDGAVMNNEVICHG